MYSIDKINEYKNSIVNDEKRNPEKIFTTSQDFEYYLYHVSVNVRNNIMQP